MGTRVLVGGSLMHGGGIDAVEFEENLERYRVDYVATDAGSTDPGPAYLGSGLPMTHREGLKQSLEGMLAGTRAHGIPLLIGSAGIAGRREQVDLFRDLIVEIARERELPRFNLATIYADVPRETVSAALAAGRIRPLGPTPLLTEERIGASEAIVAMMGAEPLIAALERGADVVLAGRSSDSALFAAYPLWKGASPAAAWHMAKTIECGALCAERPAGARTSIWAEVEDGAFVVGTTSADARCTPVSVAAHTLYENPSPYELVEPSGTIDTRDCRYEPVDEASVRVSGTRFIPAPQYTVKLEGVERVGYRTVTLAGVDDPILIAQLDEYLAAAADRALAAAERQGFPRASIRIGFRRYGSGDPLVSRYPSMAAGVLADVIAPTQHIADACANILHGLLLHSPYDGRLGTGGNMGFPFSPCDIPCGPVHRFSIWHVMAVDDPLALFPIELTEVGNGAQRRR